VIGLDTNVLVRFIIHDDASQTADALAVMRRLTPMEPGFVSHVVLAELWWVLGRSYRVEQKLRCSFVADLLDTAEIRIEDSDTVRKALADAQAGADLADALIFQCSASAGCLTTITFDNGAVKKAGMTDIHDYLDSSV